MDAGYRVFAGEYGFQGLLQGQVTELEWMSVSGWASRGGSELGSGRYLLTKADLPQLDRVLRDYDISAMLILGGMSGYQNLQLMEETGEEYESFRIPTMMVPASINNNLPNTEFCIGADTALNSIVSAIDKLKDTAGANKRVFVVEVMGYHSGYLALMAALASGAEQVYLPEEGITLQQLVHDVHMLRQGFEEGKRLSILVLNERASAAYDLNLIRRIMEEEGGELFDVRAVVLAHTQRGGPPSPFDRILASRLADAAINHLIDQGDTPCYRCVGLVGKHVVAKDVREALAEIDWPNERPQYEWYMELRDLARLL